MPPFSYSRATIQINSSPIVGGVAGRILFIGPTGLLSDNADLTYGTSTGFATGTVASSSVNASGTMTAASLTVSNLTSGRIPIAGTAGLLGDRSDFSNNTSGQMSVNTINLTGGNLIFPASAASPSSNNSLADYEKGTFTPAVCEAAGGGGGTTTYTTRAGNYVKVGESVDAKWLITVNVLDVTYRTGVKGYPFANMAATVAGSIGYYDTIATASAFLTHYLTTAASFSLFANTILAAAATTNIPDIHNNASTVVGSVTYQTA